MSCLIFIILHDVGMKDELHEAEALLLEIYGGGESMGCSENDE